MGAISNDCSWKGSPASSIGRTDSKKHSVPEYRRCRVATCTSRPAPRVLVFADRAPCTLDQFNPTDLEVLNLIASGLAVKEIASRLALTQRSVYRILTKLRSALGVHSAVHLLDAARA
jgi:DNA-binding NarL/FixJ family response regulator